MSHLEFSKKNSKRKTDSEFAEEVSPLYQTSKELMKNVDISKDTMKHLNELGEEIIVNKTNKNKPKK